MIWKDPVLRFQLLLWAVVTLICSFIALALSPAAALAALTACLLLGLALLYGARRQRKTLEALCQDLDRLLHGDTAVNLDAYSEGNWSILHNQLVKLMGQLLERTDQLTREKSRLADSLADISHQIRTPLTAINLLGRQLSSPELSQERRRECSLALRRQLDRLDWLVSALLRLSRLDAGTVSFRREPVALEAALEQAAAPLAVAMELAGQTFRHTGSATFTGDLAWTTEALGNILKNCVEHTPSGGVITAEITQTPLYAQAVIYDTGAGIDPEDLPNLFQRFYRGKTAAPESVGIGLSLARMIVTAQNGTIQASNRRQGGAQFTVRFYFGSV